MSEAATPPALTPEQEAAIEHAIRLMEQAPKLGKARRFTREEMHER